MPAFDKAKKLAKRNRPRDDVAAAENLQSDDEAPAAESDKPSVVQFNEPAQWVERMALTAVRPLPADLAPDDDPKREEVFVQHTLLSVVKGLQMLESAGVPWRRPKDYYAEMFKDDVQMNKIRESIGKSKQQVEERAHRRAMKDQKKFGKEVQAEVLRQRAKHKRDLSDRISDWKKKTRGNKERLDDVIDEDDGDNRGGKRQKREGGRGGQPPRPKNLKPGGGKRPGKNARRRK